MCRRSETHLCSVCAVDVVRLRQQSRSMGTPAGGDRLCAGMAVERVMRSPDALSLLAAAVLG
eukprot:11349067-Heterocapsa_arctica.AAC.1